MARAIDAEKYMKLLKEQYLHHKFMGNQQMAKAWQGAMQLLYDMPTLTPPNEWVNRVRELDELYTKLQIVTGFAAEQLLEMFAAGYTLKKPDYSESLEEIESLAEITPPNEPLTIEQLREMDEPVWCACKPFGGGDGYWCLCQHGHITTPGRTFFEVGEIPHWVFYRRPPEGEEK